MSPAMAALLESLEAERLTPVPRASHVVAVDVDDLCVLLDYARESVGRLAFPASVGDSYGRLEKVTWAHGARAEPARPQINPAAA